MNRSPLPWRRLFALTCREATELESARLDRRLGLAEFVAVRVHRRRCEACRRFVRQLAWLQRQWRRWAAPTLDPQRRAAMQAAIAAALRAE